MDLVVVEMMVVLVLVRVPAAGVCSSTSSNKETQAGCRRFAAGHATFMGMLHPLNLHT